MQKSYFFKNQICVVPSGVEAFSEFLSVVFMVKNAVENGPLSLPHFVFRLRSNVGGD